MKDTAVHDLLPIIYSDHLDIDLIEKFIKHVIDCKNRVQRNEWKVMVENDSRSAHRINTFERSHDLLSATSETL